MVNLKIIAPLILSAAMAGIGCSSMINMVADSMSTGSSTVFTGDNDPELIGDALPFALKMYETLLEKAPKNASLHLTTGSAFIMYANAYVQTPASMLPDTAFERQREMLQRAKKLYVRGRDYVLKGIELNHPDYKERPDEAMKEMEKGDVPFLFWAAAGWMGAYSIDPFDIEMATSVKRAIAMMNRALELDEGYSEGSIHDFFISYYGSMPVSMGGSEEKARHHFNKAVEYSKGMKASPYVALASSVSVSNQNIKEYKELLNKALAVDVDASPQNRLSNIISQRKARWLLDHIEDKFLDDKN